MISWILWSSLIVIWFSFLMVMLGMNNRKKNIVLGIQIPTPYEESEEVAYILKKYRRQRNVWAVIFFSLSFIIFLFHHFTLIYGYFLIYFLTIFVFSFWVNYSNQRQLKDLKRKAKWISPSTNIRYADTKLSLDENGPQLPRIFWMFLPLPLIVMPFFLYRQEDLFTALLIPGTTLFLWALLLFVFMLFRKTPQKIYTGDTKKDLYYNSIFKKRLLWASILTLWYFSLSNLLFAYMLTRTSFLQSPHLPLFIGIVSLCSGIFFVASFLWNQHTLRKIKIPAFLEEEAYDTNVAGMFYFDPHNPKTFIMKSNGMSSGVNLATKKGRVYMASTLGITFLLLVGILFYLIGNDLVDPHIDFFEDHLRVQSFDYKDTLYYRDIEEIYLVDQLKYGYKSSGSATETYLRGNFFYKGLGKSRVYVFRDHPPYLIIKSKNKTIIFNEKSAQNTLALKEALEKQQTKH